MFIYLVPGKDAQLDADMLRLAGRTDVVVITLRIGVYSVKKAVRHISSMQVHGLVLPDDYHRHNALMEDVKQCAYHMGLDVMPLTRFLLKNPSAPAIGPGTRQTEGSGADIGLRTGVG